MIRKIVRTNEELDNMYMRLKDEPMLACDTETTDLILEKLELTGIGIGCKSALYYIPYKYEGMDMELLHQVINTLLDKTIIMHNAKYDLKVLKKFGFKEPESLHDTLLMSWLSDENTQNGLKYLAKTVLKREVTEFKEVAQAIDLFHDADSAINSMGEYCMDDVLNTFDLFPIFEAKLKRDGIWKAYEKLELPFMRVLTRMETIGVQLDLQWLKDKKIQAEAELKVMTAKMYASVNKTPETLNINSPMQLEKLLFDELHYPALRITPGKKRSTDNVVLEELVKQFKLDDTQFIPLLLTYRDLDKVYRTYICALQEQVDTQGAIHGSFMQHGTRTGRLSSRDPNLQNIPARHDQWDVRTAFIPRPGHTFIVADYSQIELRVLAHYSQDEHMMEAFQNGEDIHAKTMQVTGITERRIAKAINFGLVYGMGPRKLASQLDIKEKDAFDYIEKFFKGYPKVRPFISRVQQLTLQNGYVTMLTGRRRRFSAEVDSNWFNTVKRQSINTKIQGSAADIMKLAMLRLDKEIEPYNARQLIQVHDEIVFEVPNEHLETVKGIVTNVMETAVQLRVPLKIGMQTGDHWVK